MPPPINDDGAQASPEDALSTSMAKMSIGTSRSEHVEGDSLELEYPHWKFMEDGGKNLEKSEKSDNQSKYNRVNGPYVRDKKPRGIPMSPTKSLAASSPNSPNVTPPNSPNPLVTSPKSTPNTPKKPSDANIYKVFSQKEHGSCPTCEETVETTIVNVTVKGQSGNDIKVQMSVPKSHRFTPLAEKFGISVDDTPSSCWSTNSERRKLNSWIFTPTYDRHDSANLNLTHAMVDMATGNPVDFVQILVVRPEEFTDYRRSWQSTHAILQLPSTLEGDDGPVTVAQGGVGFARLFIQLFAEQFELGHIFMVDDNIPSLFEVVKSGEQRKEWVSMFRVLSQLESQFECHDTIPRGADKFTPFCDSVSKEKDGSKQNCCKRHSFTGPPSQYAILGVLKWRPSYESNPPERPFKRMHVYSLVLVNVDALRRYKVKYNPWPVWEDLNINDQCDKKRLWVCKYNRFLITKNNIGQTWAPKCYKLDENDTLANMEKNKALGKDWLKWLEEWIEWRDPRVHSSTEEMHILPDDSRIDEYVVQLKDHQKKLCSGSHSCIVLKNLDDPKTCKDVLEFFTKTPRMRSFNSHVIFVSTKQCVKDGLLTLDDFYIKLVKPCFGGDVRFEVVSSHNIDAFNVPMLLLYVERKAFHTSDDDDSPANAGPSSGTIGPKNKKAEDADHSNVDQITDQLGTMNIEDRESSSEQDHSVG